MYLASLRQLSSQSKADLSMFEWMRDMVLNTRIELPTERESKEMAARMAECIVSPAVITFSGEIGAGKTTMIRSMLQALGVQTVIKSPTFSLVESYQGEAVQIHHFDLYRIEDETELDFIGFRDYFRGNAICCIEWPERAPRYLSQPDLGIHLSIKGAGREVELTAYSSVGSSVLVSLTGEE